MDSLSKVLKEIDALVAELKSLLPMKKEDEERLWRKFRLEWNYNSNHIEGNTLTYGQTELLLIFDKTTGDHEMREYEEMKAHDVAVQLVRDYAADPNRELTEADIREFNKIILVRPFWGNAQTPDGQPTRKQIVPGEYKREPNSVLLQNGEMFHYATPEETPAKMQALVEWYRKASAEKKEHAVVIAAKLHYEFVRIHPFDDCNGRTSRLLMNYVLLRNGLPPVIIKTADKKGYLNALNKADVGDLNAFVEYVAKELKWSLEISNKAARGESVEEPDDVDKEIDVISRKLNSKQLYSPARKPEHVVNLFYESGKLFLDDFFEKFQKLSSVVALMKVRVFTQLYGHLLDETLVYPLHYDQIHALIQDFLTKRRGSINKTEEFLVRIILQSKGIKGDLSLKFSSKTIIDFSFNEFSYSVSINEEVVLRKLYSQEILKEERTRLSVLEQKRVLGVLKTVVDKKQ